MVDKLPIVVTIPNEGDDDHKGIIGWFSQDAELAFTEIPVDRLKDNLGSIASSLGTLLDDIRRVGRFNLREVTVQVEVSADGGVHLIGTANLGGKGAITLKFSE